MAVDADLTRAVDRLRVASVNHARARGKLDRAELARARAVVDARAAGMTSREIGAVLGLSHVHVMNLARAGGTRPDPSATSCAHVMLPNEDRCERCGLTGQAIHAGQRGAPEPTPVGVLLARALEVTAEQPDPSATEWEAECAEFGCHEQPDPSVTGSIALDYVARPEDVDGDGRVTFEVRTAPTCARVGCREAAVAGKRFCAGHGRS